MGTSQSHRLKTLPQWSTAKRSMTGIIQNTQDEKRYSSFMRSFWEALGDDGLYVGGSSKSRHSSKHAFGKTGAIAAINLLGFFSSVKESGIYDAIESLSYELQDKLPENPKELILQLCAISASNTDADQDSEAAMAAKRRLLSKIFKDCGSISDIESRILEATDDTIDSWIIEFEVEYIVEYQGALFQSHIFDKAKDPESIMNGIRSFLHSKLDKLLAEEMHHINIFSEQGRNYIDSLTSRILSIWKQE